MSEELGVTIMKIICIGRNYLAHIAELDRELPKEPLFFMKPETALLPQGMPFPYPAFSEKVHYETELVLRMGKEGVEAITVGVDFTARDVQQRCIEKGHPWEKAKAFDYSAPVGEFKKISELTHPQDIGFGMKLNGQWVQQGHSSDMIFSFDTIIAHVSKYVTLKEGDLVFTGTPQGVGEVHVGDKLELFLEDEKVLEFEVK